MARESSNHTWKTILRKQAEFTGVMDRKKAVSQLLGLSRIRKINPTDTGKYPYPPWGKKPPDFIAGQQSEFIVWRGCMMKAIVIRPLTPELSADYLDFFDHRAFTDDNPNGPCYCTSPNQDEKQIENMVSEFKSYGVKETLRKYAVEMLDRNQIHGYLAYDGDQSIGWCNAADIESYAGFVPAFARDITCGKTISIVCFEIAPEYRGMGIASAFIDRVCTDAKSKGYVAVEGYAVLSDQRNDFDFQGPLHLYQKAGFIEVARENGQAVMRKLL